MNEQSYCIYMSPKGVLVLERGPQYGTDTGVSSHSRFDSYRYEILMITFVMIIFNNHIFALKMNYNLFVVYKQKLQI